jgi:hypothetical protein
MITMDLLEQQGFFKLVFIMFLPFFSFFIQFQNCVLVLFSLSWLVYYNKIMDK